jgi:hypothetical protein
MKNPKQMTHDQSAQSVVSTKDEIEGLDQSKKEKKPDLKIVGNVLQTTDYDIFKIVGGNRGVIPYHLERLKASMQEEYLVVPIIVNENYEVIDGQHRLENAKTLKKPVYFIMLKGYGLRQIQRLNSNMKNWNADDFMEGYCQIGMKDYVLYREFKNKYKFGHNECLAILTGQSKKVNHEFSKGLFKVKNYEESCDTAEKITMYRALYPGFRRRAFVYAMITLLRNPKFDTKEMISKLAYQSTKLVDCTNTKQYLMLLEDIYNFKRKGEPVRFI